MFKSALIRVEGELSTRPETIALPRTEALAAQNLECLAKSALHGVAIRTNCRHVSCTHGARKFALTTQSIEHFQCVTSWYKNRSSLAFNVVFIDVNSCMLVPRLVVNYSKHF